MAFAQERIRQICGRIFTLAQFSSLRFIFRSMNSRVEYLIVSASLRSNSRSRILANYLAECYQAEGVGARLLDLRDFSLPFCDGETVYNHPEVLAFSHFLLQLWRSQVIYL